MSDDYVADLLGRRFECLLPDHLLPDGYTMNIQQTAAFIARKILRMFARLVHHRAAAASY